MLILLPPSETKAFPVESPPAALAALGLSESQGARPCALRWPPMPVTSW